MAVMSEHIKFFVGPRDVLAQELYNPLDDLEAAIVDFIDGAERSLDIAIQEIDSIAIADAIIRAAKRTYVNDSGKTRRLRVRVVGEADYLSVDEPAEDPHISEMDEKHEINRLLHAALLRAKVWVRTDFNPRIFHQKFIVRDNDSVLTGSTNFTHTGTHRNLNHILIVENEEFAKIFAVEFDEISKGHFGKYNVNTSDVPREVVVDDIRLKVCFAPDHAPEMEVVKQMTKAKERIDFAIFTFSKSSGIDDAMLLCMDAGRRVRGALERKQGGQDWAATVPLKQAGAELYFVHPTESIGKLHHKLMVIDDSVIVLGSFNYTGSANKFNDENIVVLGDHTNPSDNQLQFAKAARAEIDRIIVDHGRVVEVYERDDGSLRAR
ncbi:phospholipase D-like domain-containing protein [Polycladidibacter stylochi]|uniref:phospholipase D-like domain-containing protein n=1 Tax=Polycladidibacter stylochi TaxID=1807766 RepID=UPI000831B20B|nr:phospholipase D-like domain-containing protein [Pseudovibrio stylochi]